MSKASYSVIFWFVGIATVIFLLAQCPHRDNRNKWEIGFTSDTLVSFTFDSIEKKIPSPGPAIVETVFIGLPLAIDTISVIRSYFTKYIVSDTLRDSSLVAVIIDTIDQNKITGRSFSYKWLKPLTQTTIVNNTTVNCKSKASLYVGIDFSFINNTTGVTPRIIFSPKETRHAFSLGFDVLNKGMSAGFYYNLIKQKP